MKLKFIYLWMLMLGGMLSSLQAQNVVVNGTFDVNTPAPQSGFICNTSPWAWQASVSPTYSPLTGVQWEYRWHTSWWIDVSDCGYGNGRWVKQDVPTTIGQTYIVGLDLLSNPWYTAGVDVYLNGVLEAHFDNIANGNPSVYDWERFEFCWVATTTVTEIKIVGNAPTGAACPVIGLDNVSMEPGTGTFPFEITLSNECAPAVVGYTTTVLGTSTWYYNGGFLASNQTTVAANVPGTYTIEYVTPCGTVTKDTVVVLCDTCTPQVNAREFCLGDPTYFDFSFDPNCIDPGCIGDFTVYYGDGSSDVVPAGGSLNFSHVYGGVGTYSVQYCWENLCDNRTYCDSTVITIIDCDTCEPEVTIYEFCLGQRTYFDFVFDEKCFEKECLEKLVIDFGDGTSQTIYAPGPFNTSHTYAAAGSYVVKYCWYNRCTGERKCVTVKIVIKDCGCEPEASIQQFCFGQPTLFDFIFAKECIECISHVEIEYGDGTAETQSAPFHFSHTYPAPGFYTVTYCWFNHCTGQRLCQTVVIEIINCDEPCIITADFAYSNCNPVQFVSTSISNYPIINYVWDFGDGTSDFGANPVHHFPGSGWYYVCLRVTAQKPNGETCEAEICKWIYVDPCVPSDGGGSDVPTEPAPMSIENAAGSIMALYPNPAQSKVLLKGITQEMNVSKVILLSVDGKQITEIPVNAEMSQVEISLDKLSSGTYLVRVVGEKVNVHLKLIKE